MFYVISFLPSFKSLLSKITKKYLTKTDKPLQIKTLILSKHRFRENISRKLKVFSLKNLVVFFQIPIAFCAVCHYHKNVLSEMSRTNFGGNRNEKTF
jgi:hypothetical protein